MSQLKCCVERKLAFWGLLVLSVASDFVVSQISAQGKLFEGCDYEYKINPGETYLESPFYPSQYPTGTSCRYRFVAPLNYGISVRCTFELPQKPTSCSTERLYIAVDGDLNMIDSEFFCGRGSFTRLSMFRSVTISYVSQGNRGRFSCQLNAQPRACDCGWSLNTRIRNGEEALPNEFPSAVGLADRTSPHVAVFCGASIISHYYLITAAHCSEVVPGPEYIVAVVGDHNIGQEGESRYAAQYDIAQIIVHPNFNSTFVSNDIAILRTATAIEWSRGVGPICLPPQSSNLFKYQEVTVIGWGTLSYSGIKSPTLQKARLLITDNQACTRAYAGVWPVIPSNICTYDSTGLHRDSCQYDSGGPVILRKSRQFQVGIISSGKACGQGGYSMGVNTRITSFLTWIESVTQSTTCKVSLQ